jgi:hypothetical protein
MVQFGSGSRGAGPTIPPTRAGSLLRATTAGRAAIISKTLTGILRFRMELAALHEIRKDCCHGQIVSGRLTTIGVGVLRTTTHRNACVFDGLISMCGR